MILTDKRFWIWASICAIIPFIMGLFAITILISPYINLEFSDLLHSENIEIFIIITVR